MSSLKEKIDDLPAWFNDMKNPRSGVSIHDVIEIGWTLYVIWSDKKGYSVSYRSNNAQGCSDAYKDIFKCIDYIKSMEGM